MHVIDYELMVGVPRESKQHLDAVCMCGRLERVVQPAFRLVTRRSAGALRECVTAMVARSMVGRPARDTAAHSSAAPTVGAGATGWQLLSGSAVEGWAILVTGLLQLAPKRPHFDPILVARAVRVGRRKVGIDPIVAVVPVTLFP